MFDFVHMVNFRSFGDTTLDLTNRSGYPKNLVLIYGENGSGKTNIASAFYLLDRLLSTMNVRAIVDQLLQENPDLPNEDYYPAIKELILDMPRLIRDNKMINSDGNMVLEFGFFVDGAHGTYAVETNDTEIVREQLIYRLVKNKTVCFDITPEKMLINPKLFKTKETYREILDATKKYWGKHSFLSILLYEMHDKAASYINQQVTDSFHKVVSSFLNISLKTSFPSNHQEGNLFAHKNMLHDYSSGIIEENEVDTLNNNEVMLNSFLKSISHNTIRVFYKKTPIKGRIKYQLYHTKIIAGKARDIPFSLESTGTKALVELIPYLLVPLNGGVSIIDEFETGLHTGVTKSLIKSLSKDLNGQLILTTHATILMESLYAKNIYIINEFQDGLKEIKPITYYDSNLNENTNISKRYLEGAFGGMPAQNTNIDFSSLLKLIEP